MATGRNTNDAILLIDGVIETCNISPSFQNVYFKFEVVEGKYYEFRCFSDDDTYGHLYNQNGIEIASDDDSGGGYDPLITYLATYTGIVYFRVRAYSSSSTINNVQVSAKEIRIEISQGTSFENAIEIPDDGTLLDQQLNPNPMFPFVYFKFNIEPNYFYTFQTYGNIDLVAYLYDQNKREIATDDDGGQDYNPLLTYRSTEHGFLYVAVRPYSSGSGGSFQTELTKIEIQTRPGDSFGNPIPLELNTWRNESFFPLNDGVYFIASLTEGKTYTVRINREYDVDIFFDAGESFQYLDYDFEYEDGNYLVYDFTATSSNIYIVAYSSPVADKNGLPFELFLEETDVTIPKSIEIAPSDVEMKVGNTIRFTAIVKPSTVIDKSVTWESSNPQIASVDATGLVTGISAGSTSIYASTSDGRRTANSYITVREFDGSGTRNNPFLVSNVEELQNVSAYPYSYFEQTEDIDLSGIDFEPIGKSNTIGFRGSFDGKNFKIKNLTINTPYLDIVALFSTVYLATLKNIHLVDVDVTGRDNVGALVGYLVDCTIENCSSSGEIKGIFDDTTPFPPSSLGGLIGTAVTCKISFCSSSCTVGGLNASTVGGLIGGYYGKGLGNTEVGDDFVRCCYATGDVKGVQVLGGFAGSFHGHIQECYATGDIIRLARNSRDYSIMFGGFLGSHGSGIVSDCFATGNIVESADYRYGNAGLICSLAGDGIKTPRIVNCYSTVEMLDARGGKAGICADDKGHYQGCLYLGSGLTNNNSGSSLLGDYGGDIAFAPTTTTLDFSVSDCYVLDSFFMIGFSNRYESVTRLADTITASQAKTQSFYESIGWNFDTIWKMEVGYDYPILQMLPNPKERTTSEGYSRAVLLSRVIFKRMDEGGISG